MGRYITTADLQQRLPNEFAMTYTAATPELSAAMVAADIAAAEDVIDAALARRYGAPITGTIPSLVKTLALDLAAWNAWARGSTLEVPQKAADARKAAMDLLDKAASGRFAIPGLSEVGAGGSGSGSAVSLELSANPPRFKRDQLKGW